MLSELAEGVLVHESECIQSNAVVVQGEDGVLLVDPGITDEEMAQIASDVVELDQPVVAGFSTHPDWDHALWHPAFGDVPRYGTARCAAALRDLLADPGWMTQLAEGLPPEFADDIPLESFGLLTGLPPGADRLPWDGPQIRIIEHRAHASGHAALLIEESGVLVAGDMVSDVLVPMPDPGAADPIGDYLSALALLEEVADEVRVVVPGHGSVGGADQLGARIELDRRYMEGLRQSGVTDDPRIGSSAKPGWEWVSDVHAWLVDRFGPGETNQETSH